MPIDKSRLNAYLDAQEILAEEKAMWLEVGFYVYANGASWTIRTHDGDYASISSSVAKALRRGVIAWWEDTKTKAAAEKSKPATNYNYDPLETQR